MAKKPLTPEQAEIKAIKKARRGENAIRFFAFLLAVVITVATVFIAKGQAEKASANAGGGAVTETTTKPVEAEGEKVDDVAAALEIVNKATADAVKASYKWARTSEYVDPIDVGSATGILNGIIQGIDKNSDLNSVVGGFLGIGNKEGTVTAGAAEEGVKEDYLLKAMSLTESDVSSLAKDGDTYNIVIKDCANVKKDGSNSLSRVTNDFITHEEVVDGISGFTTAIQVTSSDVQFSAIQVSATIVEGKLTNLVIKYHFKATLNLKAGLTITGKGSADYSMTYSEIAY